MRIINESLIENLLVDNAADLIDVNEVVDSLEIAEAFLEKRAAILESAAEFLPKIPSVEIAGDPLRQPQKMLGLGFYSWLKHGQGKPALMGRAVMPMGIGKLRSAVMLSEMVDGRTLFFCYSKNLGVDAKNTFEKHQLTKSAGEEKSIGQCYGGELEIDSDITVAHFASLHNMKDFDWKSVNLIVVDEADVNGLSTRRATFLNHIALIHGIPIVAMSATEQQSSGKNLETVFPDEVLRMPMPDSLPQLFELDLVPQMSFNDLYFDLKLAIDTEDLQKKGDLTALTVREFIKSTAWNQMILDHFKDTYLCESQESKGIVVFRDNKLVDDFVERASSMGIKALGFTGDLSVDELALRQDALNKGDIDLLVGSRLLGRGFNVEGINVVYNSTVSYSPQVFWQIHGRGMRLDAENVDKNVDLFTVLPRFMFDKRTGELLKPIQRPLCHAAFFDPDYFNKRLVDDSSRSIFVPDQDIKRYSTSIIHLSNVKSVRSVEEVSRIMESYRKKPDNFLSKPRIYAEFIESLGGDELGLRFIRFLQNQNNSNIRGCAKWLIDSDDEFYPDDEMEEENDSTKTDKFVFNSETLEIEKEFPYFDITDDTGVNITMEEERQLIDDYQNWHLADDPSLKKIADLALKKLLESHIPVIKSLAERIVDLDVDVDDLVQVGSEQFVKSIANYGVNTNRQARLAKYVLKTIWFKMLREHNEIKSIVRFPVHINAFLYKIKRLQVKAISERGKEFDEEELAELMDRPVDEIREFLKLSNVELVDPLNLDELIESVDVDPLILSRLCEQPISPEHAVVMKVLSSSFRQVLETLTPSEQEVLSMRFGIGKESDHDLDEVGKEFGVTIERIRQIEAKALRKLRHPSRAKRLKVFLYDSQQIRNKYRYYIKEDLLNLLRVPTTKRWYWQFSALRYSCERLKNDKEVVLAAVMQDGRALAFASEELRNDKEVVLAAVMQDGRALRFASEELRNDKEVVMTAVKQDGSYLDFASDRLKNELA